MQDELIAMIEISPSWKSSHPGSALGILSIQNVQILGKSANLDSKRIFIENQLRERYKGMERGEILELTEMAAYSSYYKRFKKTYHLLLQLESVAKKDRPIPQAFALVQAMFMAEMNSFLLTAGHDLDQIQGSIKLAASNGEEVYTQLMGQNVTCKSGDMVMSDGQSVICSVIYGQNQRTSITQSTDNVLYVVYVPPGISVQSIENHLSD
jgi:DNA/RNA-binding domain of Phe-tRNA-synthetase-like protein